MPDMIPVGNTNYVPPPNSGLNTLSSILGLQQQRQALVSGQLGIQKQQADLVPAQQIAQETQAGAQLLSDPVANGIVDKDGNVTQGAHTKILQAMPTQGDKRYDELIKSATGNVQYKNAWLGLRANVRQDVSARMQGTAVDSNSGLPEIHDTLDQIKSDYAGTPAESDVNKVVGVSKSAIDDAASSHGLPGAKSVIDHFSSGGLANTGLSGVGGLARPQATTNAANQNLNRNPITGGITPPPNAPLGSAINPASSTVAGKTAENVARGGGPANADIETSNKVVDSLRDARANIDLTKRIDQLADVVDPGALPSKVSTALGALGFQNVNQARTELDKDLNRLKGSLASRSQSDTRAGPILEQIPDSAKPTQTIHQAMDITRGFNRQDMALGALREKNSGETGGKMNGFQGDYAHAVGAVSPLMHEYNALSPSEQVDFFKRNFSSKEQAKAFRAQVESVKKRSPDVLGQ